MKPESRGLLAITVSILVFLIWYSFIAPKFWPKEEAKKVASEGAQVTEESALPGAPAQEAAAGPAEEEKVTIAAEEVEEIISTFDTDKFVITFTNYGGIPKSWDLKDYTVRAEDQETPVALVPAEKLPKMPLAISFDKENAGIPDVPQYQVVEQTPEIIRYRWANDKVVLEKIYTVGKKPYDIDLKVVIKNVGGDALVEQFSMGWSAEIKQEKKKGILGFLKRPSDVKMPVYLMNGKVSRERATGKITEAEIKSGKLYWSGIEDRYFLSAILPRSEEEGVAVKMEGFTTDGRPGFYSGIVMPQATIAPGGKEEYSFTVYGGPKEMKILKDMGMNLDKAINYGWFTFIAIPILYVLKFLYSIVRNYGVAIIILTILIKFLLYPISKRSMKSMKGMQKLQPRLKELKEKYKNDKERLNLEMMQLFKTHKVNPMSGCLPMILQLPVYIALYRVLWNSIELYQAPFFWFYKDLSQPDPYYITPVFLGVAMLLQQKLTPSASADPTQQKMMMIMPLMFAVFLAFLPVGLVIYILVNTLITIAQQWMNNNDVRLRDLIRGRLPKRARA